MSTALLELDRPAVFRGDLPTAIAREIYSAGEVACDIETSGLEWASARIALCQFFIAGRGPALVKVGSARPENICAVIESQSVLKVFHHASFDLSFMAYHWDVAAANVWCTKIAAKLLEPRADKSWYSLQQLAARELGVYLDKSPRLSNWLAKSYEAAQIAYAAGDVAYLLDLKTRLVEKLNVQGKSDLAAAAFAHIPTRVRLDVGGYGDVYAY